MLYAKHPTDYQIKNKNVFLVLKSDIGDFNFPELITTFNKKYNTQLENNIILVTNKFSYKDLNNFYNCADLYVTTTSGEGWGLTAFEFLKLNIYTLVPNNISYVEYFSKELLYDTELMSIRTGRNMEDIFGGPIAFCILSAEKSYEFKITYDTFDNIDIKKGQQFIISPNDFNSLNDVLTHIQRLISNNKLENKFHICIRLDNEISYTFYDKIMLEIYNSNFNMLLSFLFEYNIICRNYDAIDSLITQVKIPILDKLVDKMIYYIRNKEDCDKNIKIYSKEILKGLSNDEIGDQFANILKDIIME